MRSLGVCLVLVSAGIASQARAQVSDPPVPAPAAQPEAPQLGRTAQPARSVPLVNDPMLETIEPPPRVLASWQEALSLVRSRSTSIATAHSRIADANARARQALSSSLPEISGQGSVRRDLLFATGTNFTSTSTQVNVRIPSPATVWNAGVSLRQPLFDLRSWYDVGTSDRAVAAATSSAEDVERLALGGLADSIVTVITAERLAEVSRVSLRSNLETLDLTRRRKELGAASGVDVLRVEQEVASNRLDVVQSDESLRQARESLGMALGYPEGFGVAPNIKVDALATDARSACVPVSDPSQRSDVRAAELNLQVTERNVSSLGYGFAPTLDLVSDLNYTTRPTSARPVQWSIGAVLNIPIYDGGRLSSERAASQANATAAREQLTDVKRRAQLEATRAQRSVQVAEANFTVSRQARDIAEESSRLARFAFEHGTGTSFDLVESARRQRLSEIDVTIKEFEVVRARIAALLALSNCHF